MRPIVNEDTGAIGPVSAKRSKRRNTLKAAETYLQRNLIGKADARPVERAFMQQQEQGVLH